jgi:hypothetical protein
MRNETGTFRVEFSQKIQNGPRFKMKWNLFYFVLFFKLVWNILIIPDKTKQNGIDNLTLNMSSSGMVYGIHKE